MPAPSIENVFARSWQLLRRNAIIIVPGLVIGIVAGVLTGMLNPPVPYDPATGLPIGAGTRIGGSFASAAIGLLAQVLTIAYTTGMAGAAWERGTATLDDGTTKFREDGGRILIAILLYAAIAIVLAIVTFGLGALIFAYFALYAMPAVVLRNLGPVAALRESAEIAYQRWLPTTIMIVVIAVVAIGVGIVAGTLAFVPLLGPVVAAVVLQALVAYFTIVVVGEYRELRGAVPTRTGI